MMKKDLLAIAAVVLIVVVLMCGTKIQSVDDYYLEHIDDITADSPTVTVSVRCDTILDNWDSLDENLRSDKYVPRDGAIVADYVIVLRKNDTVYEILRRVTRHYKLTLDIVTLPEINSVYVKGINQLYEFSCGELSGWTFRVNGVVPSVDCASYKLSNGDVVEWLYTCDLGRDLAVYDVYGGGQHD